MPRRIQILPDTLTNQIAAGEVVERPASVVKELVENALDAAATRIEIVVQNGGKTEIRVADDGCGLGREDALLALDRHATSKISSAEDLQAIRTLGFRGEALPSVASVSRFTLETAERGGVGTRVRVAGGRILGVEDCARQTGTTVIVQSLFFNLPVRAKFLRSAAAETRAIAEVVTTLALAHLSAAFRLESNGRILLDLPAAPDLVARLAAIWGDDLAGRLVAVGRDTEGVTVAGLVERPDTSSAGPRRVYLFVSGRPFRDREIVAAAERGYSTTVPFGARPSLFLYLDLPPGAVDVNVHPTKAEVRFRDRNHVLDAVESAVRTALSSLESAATLDHYPITPQIRGPQTVAPPAPQSAESSQLAFFVAAGPALMQGGEVGGAATGGAIAGEAMAGAITGAGSATAGTLTTELDAAVGRGTGHSTHFPPPELARRTALWQIHDTYILAETSGGLLIIDQHSAHERILFEEIMRGFDVGGQSSQRLLFPLTLRLSPAEYSVVTDLQSIFDRAGFEIEPFGGRTIIVHAAPAPHPYFNAERCLREMITELTTGSELTRAARNQHERIAMTFACKAAIKAGQRLSVRELEELYDRLFATELPSHDVHGRPAVVRLSLQELERRFGRHG
jgi:DNA mismatch repair protein MutL